MPGRLALHQRRNRRRQEVLSESGVGPPHSKELNSALEGDFTPVALHRTRAGGRGRTVDSQSLNSSFSCSNTAGFCSRKLARSL
jgi:hypothetical protein